MAMRVTRIPTIATTTPINCHTGSRKKPIAYDAFP
jgi:hypothetical protein